MSDKLFKRTEGLLVERIGTEVVVLDVPAERAVLLKAPVGAIWDACDGQRSLEGIAEASGVDEATARSATEGLNQLGLLGESPLGESPSITRRVVLGVAVAALFEVITTKPAWANCSPLGSPVNHCNNCCSGACLGGGPGPGVCS
jgi:hypothetical protein